MKKYIALFSLTFLSQFCLAQKEGRGKIDSLYTASGYINSDSGKINNLILISREFSTIFPDSGIYYGNLASNKSIAIKNKNGEMDSWLVLAANYGKKGVQDKALDNYTKALNLASELNDSIRIARIYSGMSVLYSNLKDFSTSMKYASLALAINEKMNNKFEMSKNFLSIGSAYMGQQNFLEAIQTNEKALTAAMESNYKRVAAYAYSNSGLAFTNLKQFKKALEYHFKALAIEKEMDDKYGIATEYSSISDAYAGLYASENGKQKNVLIDSAVYYGRVGIDLTYQSENSSDRIDMLYSLSKVYQFKKDYKNAFEVLSHANALKDSVFSDDSKKQIQEIETKQEVLLKQKEIEIQKLQLTKNNQQKIAMIAGIVLLTGLLIFIFRNFKKQRDINNKLKETQTQLIQQEKLASLGELTAGIAHEIQNPLNFVNNFSEVSNELIDEIQEERSKAQGTRDEKLQDDILNDIKQNLEKINHHGKRADAIVKGMLQHSRSSTGVKEPTDINALCDEYLRLSYHGLRAKDKDFNATIKSDFDNTIGKINIIPQDIGRVLLNLYNNAFYAVGERFKAKGLGYEPTVSVSTKKLVNQISISVSDNGNGIPKNIVDKIFQPFFTTKPTGQGTGLGLSLSYDIIKAHGGDIKVETMETEGTTFIIQLPIV